MNFVTGGTGFVGWHVVRRLVERGERVRALVRSAQAPGWLTDLPGVDIVRGDLRQDAAAWDAALDGCTRLYHVGALYTFWLRDPSEIYATNVDGTRELLLAAQRQGIEKIVYTSTVGALGIPKDGGSGTETTPVSLDDMTGHYKRSKYLAEQAVHELVRDGLPVVLVHPSAPVGEADRKPTPTGQMIVDFMRGRMKAYLDTGLNLIDVGDCAEGHLLAADRGAVGESYNLGQPQSSLAGDLRRPG